VVILVSIDYQRRGFPWVSGILCQVVAAAD
jgi:hypothetical protein